jgi:hypothetical protein
MGSVNPSIPLIEQRDLYLGRLSSANEATETKTSTNVENTRETSIPINLFVQNNKNLLTDVLATVANPPVATQQSIIDPSLVNVDNNLQSILSQITADPKYFIGGSANDNEDINAKINPDVQPSEQSHPEFSLNFQPSVLREENGRYVIDAENFNGIIMYFYLPKQYTKLNKPSEIKDGYCLIENIDSIDYSNRSKTININVLLKCKTLWRVSFRGDNKVTEEEVLNGMDYLHKDRARIYNKKNIAILLNHVGACLKEIIRRNRLPEDNIRDKWTQWMTNHLGDQYDYDEMWENAKAWKWSSQQFLKWIKLDSHDSSKYFEKYPHLYIYSDRINQLKIKINPKNKSWLKYQQFTDSVVRPIELKLYKTLMIKAGMDMRKTFTSIQSLVRERISRALFICNRIAAGQELTGRLKRQLEQVSLFDVKDTKYEQFLPQGSTDTLVTTEQIQMADQALEQLERWIGDNKPRVVFYKDEIPDDVNGNIWLIIQLESLTKLIYKRYKPPQALILDEATAIIFQLSSTTLKTKEMVANVQKTLQLLIQKSDNVLCLCANMDNRILYTLSQLRIKNPDVDTIHFHEYTKKIGNRLKAEFYYNRDTLLTDMTLMVVNGKRLFIECTHQSDALDLEMFFTSLGKRVLCIHSDCTSEARSTLDNVNDTWIHFDIVIITNTVTTSVSFEKEHFHAICGFNHNDTINFRNISQMIGRVRRPIDKSLMINFDLKNYKNLDITTQSIARRLKNKVISMNNTVTALKSAKKQDDQKQNQNQNQNQNQKQKSSSPQKIPSLTPSDLYAAELDAPKFTFDLDHNGCMSIKVKPKHWFTKAHLLNKHEDNVSKSYMFEEFLNWIDEQEIPFTIKNYSHYDPKVAQFFADCYHARKNKEKSIEADAPILSPDVMSQIRKEMDLGTATYEDKVAYRKTKIVNAFKPEHSPNETMRKFYKNNYEVIHNYHDYIMNNIIYVLNRDLRFHVSIFHSQSKVDQQFAIYKFSELIGMSNLLTGRWIPQGIEGCFMNKASEINRKLKTRIFIYYDTRFFARQPDEPQRADRPNMQISDKCYEIAKLCSGAFGLHSKTINQVKTANSIFVSSLIKYFKVVIIDGDEYDQSFNGQRIRFTPYLIGLSRKYCDVASKLKTYEEIEKERNVVLTNTVSETLKSTVLNMTKQQLDQDEISECVESQVKSQVIELFNVKKIQTSHEVSDEVCPQTQIQVESQVKELNKEKMDQTSHEVSDKTCPQPKPQIDYNMIYDTVKNISAECQQPNTQVQSQVQPQVKINPLELLVEFGLRHCRNADPQHLTNRIRQFGYRATFNSLHVKSKPITDDIDKYLKSLKVSVADGLSWKSLGVKPDTVFPNAKTKYDQ